MGSGLWGAGQWGQVYGVQDSRARSVGAGQWGQVCGVRSVGSRRVGSGLWGPGQQGQLCGCRTVWSGLWGCEMQDRRVSSVGPGQPVPVLQCSATCGLGAVWRPVRCSSDGGCAEADRPVPARRCSLRPCSSWRVGNWSKVRGESIPKTRGTWQGPQNPQDKGGPTCSGGGLLPCGKCLHLPWGLNCSSHIILIFSCSWAGKKSGFCKS